MTLYSLRHIPRPHNARLEDGSVRPDQFYNRRGERCESLDQADWIDKCEMDILMQYHIRWPNSYWHIVLLTKEKGVIHEEPVARVLWPVG